MEIRPTSIYINRSYALWKNEMYVMGCKKSCYKNLFTGRLEISSLEQRCKNQRLAGLTQNL